MCARGDCGTALHENYSPKILREELKTNVIRAKGRLALGGACNDAEWERKSDKICLPASVAALSYLPFAN